jgi:hypothetical protein
MLVHVAQGSWQFWAQVWAEVKKYPSMHEIQPAAVQLLQLTEHGVHVVPER